MALDPTQIQAVAQAHGLSVTSPNAEVAPAASQSGSSPNAADSYAKRVGYSPSSGPSWYDQMADQAKGGASKFMEGVNEATAKPGAGPSDLVEGVGKILGGGLQTLTSPLAPAVAPVGDAVKAAAKPLEDTQLERDYGRDTASLPANEPTAPERILSTTNDYLGAFGAVAGGVGLADAAPAVISRGATALREAPAAIKSGIGAVKDAIKAPPSVADTINAVDPGLKGKAGVSAYRQVATGGRSVANRAGWVTEQALTPSRQAANIGNRLYDAGIKLGKDPVKNLQTVGDAFTQTETKIDTLLDDADPEVQYNADKGTLSRSLEDVRRTAPRETATIKDSSKAFNDVVDFAQQLLKKAPDTPRGLREMRQTFDAQARREYPNAFKNGAVDTKSPAGQAIQQVRDTINEHFYNTAPEGSEIQKLIQQESDLYRAADAIAPEAFATHGQTLPMQMAKFIREHPYATLFAAYEGAKHTVAPILPGF